MSEWQRIETAHRTPYENVLLTTFSNLDDYKHDIVVGFWGGDNGEMFWVSNDSNYDYEGQNWIPLIPQPTHWMSLPAPPPIEEAIGTNRYFAARHDGAELFERTRA